MNHPHLHQATYFNARLDELLAQLRKTNSVYATAAVCTAVEAALDDEKVYASARGHRPLPPLPPLTAR